MGLDRCCTEDDLDGLDRYCTEEGLDGFGSLLYRRWLRCGWIVVRLEDGLDGLDLVIWLEFLTHQL